MPDLLDHALRARGAPPDRTTADMFRHVDEHVRHGRTSDALAMLDYAQRLAPSDGRISLAIGLLRLSLGDPRASEPLEMLTQRTDWRDIRMALVRVRLQFGQPARAAVDLHAALSRCGAPSTGADIALANAVSERIGAVGWCALNNAGRAIVATGAKGVAILLDGQEIRVEGLRTVRLPAGWARARRLEIRAQGRHLIGSPIDVASVARVEGFVEADAATGALRGWCWFPAERERHPLVTVASLTDPQRRLSVRARLVDPTVMRGDEFGLPHGFAVDADAVAALGDAVAVTGPHGHALYGSPLWPRAARDDARAAAVSVARRFPLAGASRAAGGSAHPRPVDVVIPVYTGRAMTLACIDAVRAQLAEGERIIVVSDASPDDELVAALSALVERGRIVLRVETINRGFPGTANIGLRLAAGNDVVLLNSDTEVTPGWLAGLREAVHGAADIGTATPLSNDATIFSYPHRDAANPFPDARAAAELAAVAAAVNHGQCVDVPTGHGFCIYIRAECLAETGLLRDDLFAQGCGEENDFCMRARHLGWRHVAAPGVFVAHHGSRSFSAARDDLARRNLETLNRVHVGYDGMIAAWQRRDPLAESRRRIDLARLRRACAGREAVLLITHDRAGGVRRYVEQRVAAITRSGRQALLLRPDNDKDASGGIVAYAARIDADADDIYPNLRFRLPDERQALLACLQACAIREIEVNSLVGHADGLVDFILEQKAPYDVVVHDYSWFCPRITLTTGNHRYCGEPAIEECGDCVAAYGTNLDDDVSPDALVARSRRLIGSARAVVAPSNDAARRMRHHFGADVTVGQWERPRPFRLRPVGEAAGRTRPVRVCVVGAIGHEKGYGALLRCARVAAAGGLPVAFVVVGHTRDDKRLLDTGVVRITGRYDEAEAVALIAAQDADLAWLPAVWPETWSYVLTRIWQAGLYAVVHDIGAPAERVRAGGGGLVVPLHMPADRLLALFADPVCFRDQRGDGGLRRVV